MHVPTAMKNNEMDHKIVRPYPREVRKSEMVPKARRPTVLKALKNAAPYFMHAA
jgi:hypothetical protein